jgi:hypothetical protein
VQRRDRIGFGAPTAKWLREDFCEELGEIPGGEVFSRWGLVNTGRFAQYVLDFIRGRHNDAGTIWRCYALEQWAGAYAVTGF